MDVAMAEAAGILAPMVRPAEPTVSSGAIVALRLFDVAHAIDLVRAEALLSERARSSRRERLRTRLGILSRYPRAPGQAEAYDPDRYPLAGAAHVWDWTIDQGVTVLTAQTVPAIGPAAVAQRMHDVVRGAPAYLSFDVDALDPAFAPGTGTPEIGGLASGQVQAILRRLRDVAFAGMD